MQPAMMRATKMSTHRANPRQKSCTECRRRRQKCNPRKDGPCGNCARRYPPVECIMPESVLGRVGIRPQIGSEIQGPDVPASKGFNAKVRNEAENERVYISPYPALSETFLTVTAGQSSHQKGSPGLLEIGASSSEGSSSSSSSAQNTNSYFAHSPIPKSERSNDSSPSIELAMMTEAQKFETGPQAFGGVLSAVNNLNSLPIKPTLRNTELFQFFNHCVIPNLTSIDGTDIPVLFQREMLPWMIQSPLMPNIAILMASYTQALEDRALEAKKISETLSIKARVLALINDFLKQDFRLVGGEALRAVIHLVILEWFWGANVSLWAHMKGLRQMIKLRGGFKGMQDPVLVQVLILTDYEIACCFERDLYLQPPLPSDADLPIPASHPERFSSPLLPSPTTFRQNRESLGLSLAAAEILDDVRFLTVSITSAPSTHTPSKIHNTASWLHKNLEALPTPPASSEKETDILFETVRLTALIYTSSVMTLTPFTETPIPSILYANLSAIPLSRWKEIPAIFLWILLVAVPSSGNDAQGRWLKKKMAVAGMSIGLQDFVLATAQLRAFWRVQRWIAGEKMRIEEVIP